MIFCVVVNVFTLSFAQTEKRPDSKISNVTVFLTSAQVTRQVKTNIDAGKTNIILSGLTSQLDPQSIQVTGKGKATILGIQHNQNYLSEFNKPKRLQTLQDSLDIMKRMILTEQNLKDVLIKEEQLLGSNQKIGGNSQNLTVAELKAMADFYRTRLSEIGGAKIKSDEKIKQYNERIIKLNRQIHEQTDLYSRNTSEIVVSVSSESPAVLDLDVNYIVSGAGWYPVYDLRAVNTQSPIQINYKANVFQRTGEEWNNVRLTLSTGNPAMGGVKPELYPWYLDFYRPIYREITRTAKMKSAPAMEMQAAPEAVEEDKEMETLDAYTTTVQTTLNTEFVISLPYTVSSSTKPTLVDIRSYDMKATYEYAVAPKLDLDAFLVARATGWEEFNLLPGEANIFFEGTFVGKSFIDPNAIGDTLSVSLGRDKRIVVKREQLKDFTSRGFISSNKKNAYAYEISVRNTKNESIQIVVEDQVPVSQNSQIEVTVTDAGGAKYNRTTGKLTWTMTLQPNETRKVVFKYEVKFPKDKQVSGL